MAPFLLRGAIILAALLSSALFAGAAENGVIKVVLPVPPGGAGDIIARLLTDQVGRVNNRRFVIETRPGAGTMIGTEAVARSPADGSTLLINAPFLLIGPHLQKVRFDPLTSLEPVCYLVSSPGVLAVNATSPYRTFADLVQAVRAQPGQMTFASAGPGTTHHIGFAKLKRDSGLDFIYVPFSGGGPAINALLGSHVTAVLAECAPVGTPEGRKLTATCGDHDGARAIPAGCADDRRKLSGLRGGFLVGLVCACAHPASDRFPTRTVVRRGGAGAGAQNQAQ
jgi:tripartite-type tricarboxylate transporter receptor subunit TctC